MIEVILKNSVSISSDSVKELNQKANEIDTVVAYIRQIADQANMLALNASIEAACADLHVLHVNYISSVL